MHSHGSSCLRLAMVESMSMKCSRGVSIWRSSALPSWRSSAAVLWVSRRSSSGCLSSSCSPRPSSSSPSCFRNQIGLSKETPCLNQLPTGELKGALSNSRDPSLRQRQPPPRPPLFAPHLQAPIPLLPQMLLAPRCRGINGGSNGMPRTRPRDTQFLKVLERVLLPSPPKPHSFPAVFHAQRS